MSKSCKAVSKTCCERHKKHSHAFSASKSKVSYIKKTIPSNGEKSYSTGIIQCKQPGITTPKKTTKSDISFSQNLANNIDYCKNCGDFEQKSSNTASISRNKGINNFSKSNPKTQLKQFYKNENFKSTHSFNTDNMRKISLQTILEHPERISKKSIFDIQSDSDEEIGFMDPDDSENIKNIKEFRNKNYFECHSAKSRIKSKSNVTSLNNHKCVYRFYLNERLFPVPLNTDYNGNIRCIQCHLPLDRNNDTAFNGTIQAKVKFNDEIQDTLLVLPVREPLIIKEKRKEETNEDEIYFGIIKLDLNGDSIFNRTLPENSLALKYQKGYREFFRKTKYEYGSLGSEDVVFI